MEKTYCPKKSQYMPVRLCLLRYIHNQVHERVASGCGSCPSGKMIMRRTKEEARGAKSTGCVDEKSKKTERNDKALARGD